MDGKHLVTCTKCDVSKATADSSKTRPGWGLAISKLKLTLCYPSTKHSKPAWQAE